VKTEPLALSVLRKLAEIGGDVSSLETPAGRVRVSSRGPRGAPELLVFHGLGDSIGGWAQASIPWLRKFRVHLVDLPGHGLSDAPPDASQETMLSALRVVGKRFPDARLVGHSLGGWLALKLILDGSISPHELVLVNPGGATLPRAEYESFAALTQAADAEGARKYLRAAFHSPPKALELFPGAVLKAMRSPAISNFLKAVKEKDFIAPGELKKLAMPVRLIWGESDRLLPKGTLPFWKQELHGARLVLLEKAGHVPHLERPFALASAVAAKF